jgi:hypothetical protein
MFFNFELTDQSSDMKCNKYFKWTHFKLIIRMWGFEIVMDCLPTQNRTQVIAYTMCWIGWQPRTWKINFFLLNITFLKIKLPEDIFQCMFLCFDKKHLYLVSSVCLNKKKLFCDWLEILRPGWSKVVLQWSTNRWTCVHRVYRVCRFVQLGLDSFSCHQKGWLPDVEACWPTLVVLVISSIVNWQW